MSSDIYAKVQLPQKVRYTRKEQENRTDWEDKEVNIYQSAEDVDDYYSVSQPQEEGQQTQRQPAVRKSSSRRVKLCKMLPWIAVSVAIISLTICFTLEIIKLKNSHSHLSGKWCPDGWTRFGCSCYFKGEERKTWYDSRTYCQNRRSDLVIINSKAEQEFIKEFNKNGESWIGLQYKQISVQRTYDWKWVDGSPLTQSFWGTGWPEYDQYQSYAVCCDYGGKWKQDYYDYYNNWICEK
ncbi:C-type lectin domain family 4 member M-like isoform X2 [Poecilia latipinna]|uniref:C-type lectin domain family 4 member M-like isoform X2 n=1 Tax=Poecilia latipinna TaxID=48699 RepID=UPI00072DB785|nr:PREDICTED: C-type lectin domain family 4 member M-like isoform X2 [Poecilia latipinna]